MKTIEDNIEAIRIQKGKDKKELYEAIGMSKPGYDKMITNKTTTVATLTRIAEFLKTPISEFYEGIGSGDTQTASEGSINNKQGTGNKFEGRTSGESSSEAERLRLENEFLRKEKEQLEARLQDKEEIIKLMRERKKE